MNAITEAGIYSGLPEAIYHGTPTPTFALSAGFIADIDRKSPAHAWYGSRLNPRYTREEKTIFDIGSAGHLMLLEPDQFSAKVVIIMADDYRTAAAKNARDEARLAGKIPLLEKQCAMLMDMRAALYNENRGTMPFLTAPLFASKGIQGGKPEESYFWWDDEFKIWCKGRPDYVKQSARGADIIVDYKSVATTESLEDWERYAWKMSWHTRAAFYIEGHKALTGRDAEYWYLAQTKDDPYFVSVIRMSEVALEWGWRINRDAKAAFADCMTKGVWPTHREQAATIGLPVWAEKRLEQREDTGALPKAALDHKAHLRIQAAFAPHTIGAAE